MKDLGLKHQTIETKLKALLDGSCVYNQSDFNGLKETSHRYFEDELSEVIQQDFKTFDDTKMLWFVRTPYWHQLASCIKKLKTDKSQGFTEERKQSILKVLHRWEPIAQQLEIAVPLIVKGRKIGERKTPPRTLENTGTCPICGKSFKLDDSGKIVSHGYVVQWHQHNGSCFGAGKPPWELSPQGAINYVNEYCLWQKLRIEDLLQILVWSPKTVDRFTLELRSAIREITYFQDRIAGWEKKELPVGDLQIDVCQNSLPC